MKVNEVLGKIITKAAPSIAASMITPAHKLNAVLGNIPRNLEQARPNQARELVFRLERELAPLTKEIPDLEPIVDFLRSQRNNPSPGQVANMVIKELDRLKFAIR